MLTTFFDLLERESVCVCVGGGGGVQGQDFQQWELYLN